MKFKELFDLVISIIIALAFVVYWKFWFQYTERKFIEANQKETWDEIWNFNKG